MNGILKLQLRRLLSSTGFYAALFVSIAFVVVGFVETCVAFWGADVSDLPHAASAWGFNMEEMRVQSLRVYVYFAMSILAAFPMCGLIARDIKSNTVPCIVVRGGAKAYILSNATLAFLSAFFIVLITGVVSQLLAILVFPLHGYLAVNINLPLYRTGYDPYIFLDSMRMSYPFMRNVVFIVYMSLWSGLMGLISYGLTFWNKGNLLSSLCAPAIASLSLWYVIPALFQHDYVLVHFAYLFPSYQSLPFSMVVFVAIPLSMLAVSVLLIVVPIVTKREVFL